MSGLGLFWIGLGTAAVSLWHARPLSPGAADEHQRLRRRDPSLNGTGALSAPQASFGVPPLQTSVTEERRCSRRCRI